MVKLRRLVSGRPDLPKEYRTCPLRQTIGVKQGRSHSGRGQKTVLSQSNCRPINRQTKLSDLRQNLKAPGLFDGVLKTFERVQKEVESKEDRPTDGPLPQRVEIVPTPQTLILAAQNGHRDLGL